MKENVKIVFDRKRQAEKTGTGKIEFYIYLSKGEKKYEVVGESDSASWESVVLGRNIQTKKKHYEQVIRAMEMLDEEMTIDNFTKHIFMDEHPRQTPSVLFNGHDLRQSFVQFCRDHMNNENLAKNSVKGFNVVFDSLEQSGILVTLADLTPANVCAYDAWLRKDNTRSDYTMVLKRLPIMFHQVDNILMGERKEVQILFLMKLIPLVENIIAYLTISVEIITDNVSVTLSEALKNLLI